MRFNTQLYDLFSTLHGYSIRNGVILLKIERLSENQIRCTLNKADLADKQLKISELAYGSPKAKELFREMMQQASNELGFEVDDIPLMIEAIPRAQNRQGAVTPATVILCMNVTVLFYRYIFSFYSHLLFYIFVL